MVPLPCFLINLFGPYKLATIRQISYSQTCTFPQSRPEDGYMLVLYIYFSLVEKELEEYLDLL
jgi:hypothetical protein